MERAKLLETKESLSAGGFLELATLVTAIKDIEAKLRRLDAPPAAPEAKDPIKMFNGAKLEDDKAKAHCDGFCDQVMEIEERIAALKRDQDAVARAITHAEGKRELTKAALVAAKRRIAAAEPDAHEERAAVLNPNAWQPRVAADL